MPVFIIALLFPLILAQICKLCIYAILACPVIMIIHTIGGGGAQSCEDSHMRTQILLCCLIINHSGVQAATQAKSWVCIITASAILSRLDCAGKWDRKCMHITYTTFHTEWQNFILLIVFSEPGHFSIVD